MVTNKDQGSMGSDIGFEISLMVSVGDCCG